MSSCCSKTSCSSRALGLAVLALSALTFVACGGGGHTEPTPTTPKATPTVESRRDAARRVEADSDPSLPGDYVNLPEIYGATYGGQPNTAAHLQNFVDYAVQGLPPAGGPHWGSGACGDKPSEAPLFCGPVPWGIYREPWHTESLVHNMEHAGVIIWYHTSDQSVIDRLESFATARLRAGTLLVLVPYPDMEDGTVAITVWGRRDKFPASELDTKRLDTFINVLYCRFDPEHFCRQGRIDVT